MKIILSLLVHVLSCSGLANAVQIPLTFKASPFGYDSGEFFVPCSIAGREVSRVCLFDSGSNRSFLVNDEETHLFPIIAQKSFQSASQVEKTCDLLDLPGLKLGDFITEPLRALRCADSKPGNTVGINVFSEHSFAFSAREEKIELETQFPEGVKLSTLTQLPQGHLLLTVSLGTEALEAMWDTGNSVTAVDLAYIQSHRQNFTFVRDLRGGSDAMGNPVSVRLYKMKGLRISDVEIPETYVLSLALPAHLKEYAGPNFNMLLGANIIAKVKWYFDLKRDLWALQPQDSFDFK
jgi:hypothetical protein